MFGFGKILCAVCHASVPRKEGLALRDRKDVICRACYKRWEDAGRKCGRCETPVRATQSVGVLLDRDALGHGECGAARLTISF